MGRNWRPKVRVLCAKCGWTGTRVAVAKKCPKCGHYRPDPIAGWRFNPKG